MTNVDRFWAFIKERYEVHLNKERGESKPWTKDPILQQYRFCNVYRELDTVTAWIRENWRKPHKDDPDLWFAMCVARYVNWPNSLREIGYPVPWSVARFKQAMINRQIEKKKVFTGAYIVHSLGPKIPYLADKVFSQLWFSRQAIRPHSGDTLAKFFSSLRNYRGMGSFMAAQIVADVKYTKPLCDAEDWWEWAAMGPGSARGLNRVLGYPKLDKWKAEGWHVELLHLKDAIDQRIKRTDMPPIHAQDLQNALCEFDKYERVRLGEGRPRAKYNGKS